MNLIIPEKYDPVLSLRQTQEAIKYIRDTFQKEFGRALMLERISAPLFVQKSSGLNDNLNGVEKPVSKSVVLKTMILKSFILLLNGKEWHLKNMVLVFVKDFIQI